MGVYIPVELRKLVYTRAEGCCEYCGIPEQMGLIPHQMDHIIPLKHDGSTESKNLALSCTLCNKLKGSDLAAFDPETQSISRLFHPRQDQWEVHFKTEGTTIHPLSPVGRATARLLQLNQPERIEERQLFIKAGVFLMPKVKK